MPLAISQLTDDIKSISPHPLRQIYNPIGSFLARKEVIDLLEEHLNGLVHEGFVLHDVAHAVGARQRAAELVVIDLIGLRKQGLDCDAFVHTGCNGVELGLLDATCQ